MNNYNCNCNDIEIVIEDSQQINASIEDEQEIGLALDNAINVLPLVNHNDLENLDYEHSGHTGFASSQELSILESNVVKKDLSILPTTNLTQDRSRMMIYIDNNGTPSKASVSEVLSKLIRTSEQEPSDMQVGEYLFKIQR